MRKTLTNSVLFVWLISVGLLFSTAKAIEVSDLHFTELNKRQGLSDTTVLDVVEDGAGYIWLATSNGLNRYSGYDMKQYHPSDVDTSSLPSGYIQQLFIDSTDTLWVATQEGLAQYLPETDNFRVFDKNNSAIQTSFITAISESTDGDILFADMQYLYKVDKNTLDISVITEVFAKKTFFKTIVDEPNRTWIGSHEFGAKMYNKSDGKLYDLSKVNPWGIVLSVSSLHGIKIIDNNYWLATNEGIKVISASGETLREINGDDLGVTDELNILSVQVVEDNIWVGSTSGLFVLNNSTESDILSNSDIDYVHLNSETFDATGLPTAIVIKIIQDRTGVVWAATFKQGAFRYHAEYASLHFQPIYKSDRKSPDNFSTIWAIAQKDSDDIYLAAQEQGIGKVKDDTNDIAFYDKQGEPTYYWDLKIDTYGTLWAGTSKGLLVYEEDKNGLVLKDTLFDGNEIDYVHIDTKYIWVWVKSQGPRGVEISSFHNPNSETEIIDITPEVISETLRPIFTDSSQRLWLQNDDGITIYSLSKNSIVSTIGPSSGINSVVYGIYETADAFWLTTRSDGVLMIEKPTLQVVKKQQRDSDNGFIISTVGLGNSIWYADAKGVHQIHLPSLKEETFIPNDELNYNSLGEGAAFASSDNIIYFGGNKGFNKISPVSTNTSNSTQTLAPELSQFNIFGASKEIKESSVDTSSVNDESSYTKKNIIYKNNIALLYDESRFSIAFELVNPVYPKQVLYRYRFSGFGNDWFYNGTKKEAEFNNISFGQYTFEVQAREPGKTWSTSRVLNINVDRPPWLHTVALIFYALLAAVFLAFVIRQYQIRAANQLAIQESEERLKLTLWSSGDELWDWDVYKGQVYRANTWGVLDFPQDDIRTTGAYDANIHPNDIERVRASLREHLEGKSDFYELTYRAKTFKNQWIWILDRGKVVERDHNQQPVRMTGTLKNIHHLKEAEEQLNLFKRSIENISEGVFITNTQFKFISVNNAYCGYTGETRAQSLASYMHFHLYPEAFTEEIKKTLKAKGNWSGEVESVRVNGERYEMELNIDAVHDDDGKISHFVGVFSDITSRKSTEKELLKLANTDPLTELPNRSFFQASHQNLVRKASPHTLLCLDMDNFKKINDSLGHQTGDILIKQIAKRLQRITGKSATCYRLGGDEFSVLMEDSADVHTVTHYAQSVLDTLSRPFIINKQEFVLGASVGIAFFPADGTTPQEMLKNADTAMYFAKNNGGNSYQFFSGEMNQHAVRQLQIENLIRQGIKDDLFTVYYQPKVDIASGKLVSMEALVRFEHPQKGIVSPGQFIPLAEQTGQIIEIGEQVLRKACADTKRWVSQGLFSGRVAVNISAKQFELPDLDDRINQVLSEVGLSPLHLECEITEGTLMENPENGLQMMSRLRERGIHLALDDFGTGYSSLAYLKRFPLNTLKIDKAFIDDIAKSSVDRHMAAAIINIAHNLGLKVVAEGVEEEDQLDILRRYDCEMLQGFLYSRPLSAERFEKLLTENQQLHNLLGHSNI
ncbi:EAL domain-containing protein [Alteromonas sp. A079]|uniref:EAL domain-containing protein n=1 Tax=Alteromonas sp. A079 TaxID=3410268 RepID=UPI003B9E500F